MVPCAASRLEPLSCAELISRGKSGDREALKCLIERYQLRVANFILAQTRDPNAFEDLCQSVFVKMVLGLPRLRETGRFESWLFQIARNVCRDHQRALLGWRRYFTPYERTHESVATIPAEAKEDHLAKGLEELAPEDRRLLLLHFEEKKKYEELARLSNSTVSAVKSRLYRARRELRRRLATGDSE